MDLTVQTYSLPKLPYEYSALEPAISAAIMELHYDKHHRKYVDSLNEAIEKYAAASQKGDLAAMETFLSAINFNGGGHINHSIFWTNLAPQGKGGGGKPSGLLAEAIQNAFGSFERFVEQFSAKTMAIQGSGWGWLAYDPLTKNLTIATCQNQDPLVSKGLIPLFGVDVWEHAYYLQYKNLRAKYIEAIWTIVNWQNVSERFEQAKKIA